MGQAEQEMGRWVLRALAVLRAVQLLPWPVVAAVSAQVGSGGAAVAVWSLYLAYAGWSVLLFRRTLLAGRIDAGWVAIDAVLMAVSLVLVGQLLPDGAATNWANWPVPPANGPPLLAAVTGSLPWALVLASVMGVCYLAGIWGGPDQATVLSAGVGTPLSYVGFSLAVWLIVRYLKNTARRTDIAANEAAIARQDEAATQARFDERTRQYRLLHDTVLSTLSAIARGGLDHRSELVQARCAADAEFVRGLVSAAPKDAELTALPVALTTAGRRHAMTGLRVHLYVDDLPDLPAEVVDAVSGAVTEALNNVAAHAGTDQAWITATGTGEGLLVTVVDQGSGFDPATAAPGRGIDRSLRWRMTQVAGAAEVYSAPGDGTRVELTWQSKGY